VKIKEQGVNKAKESFTLYHHCDGYPTAMIPLIAGAYKPEWKHGRIGKVVSFVMAEDPHGYEMEQGHELHGDIEWYYILEVKSEQHVGAIPEWRLIVYKVTGIDPMSVSDMTRVYSGPLDKAVLFAEQIEGSNV
jgi:hypothetical protein